MSDEDPCGAEQKAALEPPGVYANKVFLNVIDGMVRVSFGLQAGGHLKYTEAVTISPGLAMALRELIETYVQPPAPAIVEPARKADRTSSEAPSKPLRRKEVRVFRSTSH